MSSSSISAQTIPTAMVSQGYWRPTTALSSQVRLVFIIPSVWWKWVGYSDIQTSSASIFFLILTPLQALFLKQILFSFILPSFCNAHSAVHFSTPLWTNQLFSRHWARVQICTDTCGWQQLLCPPHINGWYHHRYVDSAMPSHKANLVNMVHFALLYFLAKITLIYDPPPALI